MNDQPFSDILTLLEKQASAFGNKSALEFEGSEPVSYRELHHHVVFIAQRLVAEVPTKKGQRPRIGIVLSNGPLMAKTLLAAAVTGVAMPFNPGYTLSEFEAYFKDTRADCLLVDINEQGPATVAATALGLLVIRIRPEMALSQIKSVNVTLPTPQPSDVALVLLTSGSTGRAKSVPLTHRNVCTSARDVCRSLSLTSADRCLAMWEQYHVGGLVDLLLAPLASGGTVICTKGFNAAEFYRLVDTAKPNWFQVVPTTLNEIVGHARRHGITPRGTSLRFLRSVAAALSPRLMSEAEELFQLPVITTFGMTEAGPLITSTALPPAVRKAGSVGRSCGCEIRITDSQGKTVFTGVEGQVAIRGDNVFSGYEGDAVANAAQFQDGWFFTGDLGRLDAEGELTLTGRLKQLINRGGEKVNPQEVDNALLSHPAVMEAACFPVAHATLGEDVAAAVVLRSPLELSELRSYLASLLAPFKIPARILIHQSLPRNAVGKIDRLALAEATAKADKHAQITTVKATPLEERIARVWARELNLAEVAPLADFRALGGDSLSAVRIFLAVEAELGHRLPEASLTKIHTVRDMARVIERGEAAPLPPDQFAASDTLNAIETRALQGVLMLGNLQPAYAGSTLGVYHPNGTLLPIYWGFNNPQNETGRLADAWGSDQPIYSFYSGGRLFPNDSVMLERLAKHYAAEIQRIQPEGPYIIGGNCKGAWIAMRIAKQLLAEGKKVSHLLMLEYGDVSLGALPVPQLLIFGKQSHRFDYHGIGLTAKGPSVPFVIPPVIGWISGKHGQFYRPYHLRELVAVLKCYLNGQALPYAAAQGRSGRILFWHRNRILFEVYVRFSNVWSKLTRVLSRS